MKYNFMSDPIVTPCVRLRLERYLFIYELSVHTLIFEMALTYGIATPLVIEITERARHVYKKHSFKSFEDDPNRVFSYVPYGVLHNEDVREYIHYNIEELGNADMLSLYTKHMMDDFGNLIPNFKSLQDKGFI